MISIKFINATNVQLLQRIGGVVDGTDTIVSNVGEINSPTEFQYNGNTFSKDDGDYYHFAITGENVQISGTIGEVTTAYQFFSLFSGCSQITDASQLTINGSTVKDFCFSNMFKDCINLINPPTSLSAMNLAPWCYQGMFAGCVKMTSAPTLPATTLAPYCYYAMFYNCKALSSSPYLPAETLTDWCYNSMFYGCENMNLISANFSSWSENATKNWVTNVATDGKFINDSNVAFSYGVDKIPNGWESNVMPLTFKAVSGLANIALQNHGSSVQLNLKYSKNFTDWSNYNTDGQVINLDKDEIVTFSGNNQQINTNLASHYYQFAMTGLVEAKGNIQSIINYSTEVPQYCYLNLFKECSGLLTTPELPATGLARHCYFSMFNGCTSLTSISNLPATSLASSCYANMFNGCTSITAVPELPATILANNCYSSMFRSCSSLVSVPNNLLPAMDLFDNCYQGMFTYCTNLTATPSLPATGLATGCYNNMFVRCTSLSTAPVLPATTLATNCYKNMFENCTTLIEAPELSATTLVSGCYYGMFKDCILLSSVDVSFTSWNDQEEATKVWLSGVADVGTFYKYTNLTTGTRDAHHIPQGWTVINK